MNSSEARPVPSLDVDETSLEAVPVQPADRRLLRTSGPHDDEPHR